MGVRRGGSACGGMSLEHADAEYRKPRRRPQRVNNAASVVRRMRTRWGCRVRDGYTHDIDGDVLHGQLDERLENHVVGNSSGRCVCRK
ncbi:hypothetical protein EI94DRAFT_1727378 [Lactarius quietus]|nr:hypothetical protein EI94DRAFT_1727378 [Lactarius quietus]